MEADIQEPRSRGYYYWYIMLPVLVDRMGTYTCISILKLFRSHRYLQFQSQIIQHIFNFTFSIFVTLFLQWEPWFPLSLMYLFVQFPLYVTKLLCSPKTQEVGEEQRKEEGFCFLSLFYRTTSPLSRILKKSHRSHRKIGEGRSAPGETNQSSLCLWGGAEWRQAGGASWPLLLSPRWFLVAFFFF